ncbi:MAG: hypothetical protein SGILL_005926, partial [Bacillariaceae sp.]
QHEQKKKSSPRKQGDSAPKFEKLLKRLHLNRTDSSRSCTDETVTSYDGTSTTTSLPVEGTAKRRAARRNSITSKAPPLAVALPPESPRQQEKKKKGLWGKVPKPIVNGSNHSRTSATRRSSSPAPRNESNGSWHSRSHEEPGHYSDSSAAALHGHHHHNHKPHRLPPPMHKIQTSNKLPRAGSNHSRRTDMTGQLVAPPATPDRPMRVQR